MADTKVSALSVLSVPTLDDYVYIVDSPTGTPASYALPVNRLGGLCTPGICEGRLTLDSSNPVTSSAVTGASTIYFAGYKGNRVSLYDGTRWKLYSIGSALSFTLTGLTNAKNYDLFLYDNSGTLTLERGSSWTDDDTRDETLTLQDNVWTKTGSATRRYLGSFRTTSTTTTEDSSGPGSTQVGGKRFLWNYYNRVPRSLGVVDTTNTWTYTTATWRVANGATAPSNCVEYLCGLGEDPVSATIIANANWGNGSYAMISLGIDNTTPQGVRSAIYQSAAGVMGGAMHASYSGIPGIGYHSIRWLENGFGSPSGVNFEGDNNEATGRQSGLTATVWG